MPGWPGASPDRAADWDRTLGSLLASLDATMRAIGGVPTYLSKDDERTVTVERIGGARAPPRGGRRRYGRLLHYAHVVFTEGASYRLAEATAGKGVVPLA